MTQNSTDYVPTQYNVLVGSTNGQITNIAPADAGVPQILTSNGASANPSFQSPAAYSFTMARQVFTSSGTYTPTANMKYCIVECIGGGAGSGTVVTNQVSSNLVNAGGGAGSYSKNYYSAATIGASQSVTIGAGGASNSAGGTTIFGGAPLISVTGGTARGNSTGTPKIFCINPSVQTTVGTGGAFNWLGTNGDFGLCAFVSTTAQFVRGGQGGSSFFGGGGSGAGSSTNGAQANGNNATSYGGGGGSGYHASNTAGSNSGGSGFAGIIIITEFIYA